MAHLLNEPITTKESAVYSAPGLSVASSSMQGWRESMEVRGNAGTEVTVQWLSLVLLS